MKLNMWLIIISFFMAANPLYAQMKTDKPPRNLDHYINRVLQTFNVPGVSVAIVKDGKVILAKGYGVKKLGSSEPVDAHTLFAIASNSKAFTTTALALLVEQGKLKWDDPVIKYLPWFRMSNDYVTSRITIRDLLVHHSGLGLGAGDLLWWPVTDYTRDQIVHHLRNVPLATGFRQKFAYDNLLYQVAGEVISKVSGETWEDFVAGHIFKPLGMNESIDKSEAIVHQKNVSTPHAKVNGRLQIVKPFIDNVTDPAGGIATNAVDMAKWMIVQLDSGRTAEGRQLFHPESTVQLWRMVTPIDIPKYPKELVPAQMNFYGYGLGFFLSDYRGEKLVWHTGELRGYVSRVTLVPKLKLGIAVLTNQESEDAFNAITYHLLDYYLRAPSYDWISAYKTLMNKRNETVASSVKSSEATRDSTAGPSLPLAEYAGTYHDAWYGNVTISIVKGHLEIRFDHTPDLIGKLDHWQYDTFIARWNDRELRADAFVTFELNPDGTINQVRMKAASHATDFSYDFRDLLLKPLSVKGK
ncbi:MAG TPA: serine hydrolase [Balneolales bacterium]|nr:serine hydrolase [Balneolales bacterium]